MPAHEGCAPLRRGLIDHYPALGVYGVALYTWLLLKMDPQTRRLETSISEMREALGTGTTQVSRTLKYLEEKRYIDYMRGSGNAKSLIVIRKPKCPTTGAECPLAAASSPCLTMVEVVREVAAEVREEETARSTAALRIFEAWNEAGVIRHQKMPKPMVVVVNRAIKNYGEDMVLEAIENYGKVVNSKEHWFDYRYTLSDFLSRRGGANIERFCTDANPLENYRGRRGNGGDIMHGNGSATGSKYADL